MSTPLTSRRRSFNLLSRSGGKTPILSPQTHRSLSGHATPTDSPAVDASPQLPEVANDDDIRARREKRRSRTFAQATSSPHARKPVEDNLGETAKLTNDQLATHYINCIKLSTENKITAKNAFNLHLIDHMNEMLKQRCEGTLNFQMAGGTIFASAKIYASRVDAVHSEAYKVLSSLGRGSTDDKKSDDEGENADSQVSDVVRKKKKRSKILESNAATLRLKKLDSGCQTDPLDQYFSAVFDVSSTSGLLVNHLGLCPDGITLRFDSEMESSLTQNVCGGGPSTSQDDEQNEEDTCEDGGQEMEGMFSDLVKLSAAEVTNKSTVCPTLGSFSWMAHNDSFEWRDDDVAGHHSPPHAATVTGMDNPADFDDMPMDGDFGLDDDLPPPSLASTDDAKTEPSDVCGPFPVAMDADLFTSFMPGEYSYFKPGALSTWEGPNHWKMKMKNTKPKAAGTEEDKSSKEQPKGKKRKRNFYIDYSRLDLPDPKEWGKTKKMKEVTKRIQEKWHKSEEERLLPTAGEHNILNLAKCMLQPEVQIRPVTLIKGAKLESNVSQVDSDKLGAYNYDNPNDKFNYCPNMTDDEDAAPDDDGAAGDGDIPTGFANCDYNGTDHVEGFPDVTMSQSQNLTQNSQMDIESMLQGDHLVSHPRKVQKISIEYAKKATRIDVRRLKAAMWTLLHRNEETPSESDVSVASSVHEDQSIRNNAASEAEAGSEANSSMAVDKKTFSNMYQFLPKLMPTTMAESLSIPLAFTCLLHLANEKSLRIEANPDMSDLSIMETAMEIV